MTKALDEAIRELAQRGELTHLSLIPRQRDNFKGWACSLAPAGSQGNAYAEDPDPVNAILEAASQIRSRRPLSAVSHAKTQAAEVPAQPAAPKRVPKPKPELDLSDLGI